MENKGTMATTNNPFTQQTQSTANDDDAQSSFSTPPPTFDTPKTTFDTPPPTFDTPKTTFTTPPPTFDTPKTTFDTPKTTFTTTNKKRKRSSNDRDAPRIADKQISSQDAAQLQKPSEETQPSMVPKSETLENFSSSLRQQQERQNNPQQDMGGTVEISPQPQTLSEKISRQQEILETKSERGDLKFKDQVAGFLLGAGTSIVQTGMFLKQLNNEPVQTIKDLIGAGKTGAGKIIRGEGFPEVGNQLLTEQGTFTTGKIVTDIVTGQQLGKATKSIIKQTKGLLAPLEKGFVAAEEGKVKVGTTVGEKDITLAGGTASTAQPIKEQLKLAGTTTDAASAQRNLFSRRRKTVQIDKPLPTPDSPELERSFFSTPDNKLRQSRLGIVPEDGASKSSIVDLLTDDIKLKSERPQIVLNPETPIQAIPKNLQKIKAKLASGQALTTKEAQALEQFQLTPSGEFKPLGFVSTESEITLAPREIITGKKIGVTVLEGERVTIFEASIDQTPKITPDIKPTASGKIVTTSSLAGRKFIPPEQALTSTSPLLSSGSPPVGSLSPLLNPSPAEQIVSMTARPEPVSPSGQIITQPEIVLFPSRELIQSEAPSIIGSTKPVRERPSRSSKKSGRSDSGDTPPPPSPPPPTSSSENARRLLRSARSAFSASRLLRSPSVLTQPQRPRARPRQQQPLITAAPSPLNKLRRKRSDERKESFLVVLGAPGLKVFKTFRVGSLEEAARLGERKTLGTAAARVKIKKDDRDLSFSEEEFLRKSFGTKFRKAKKSLRGEFIQKRQFRIGTSGEKREITALGIMSSKKKKRSKSKRNNKSLF